MNYLQLLGDNLILDISKYVCGSYIRLLCNIASRNTAIKILYMAMDTIYISNNECGCYIIIYKFMLERIYDHIYKIDVEGGLKTWLYSGLHGNNVVDINIYKRTKKNKLNYNSYYTNYDSYDYLDVNLSYLAR